MRKPAGPNGPAFFDYDGLIFVNIEIIRALLLRFPTRDQTGGLSVDDQSRLLACAAFPPRTIVAKLKARTPALPAREAIGAVLVSETLRQRCVIVTRHDRGGPADKAFKYLHGGAPVRQRTNIVGHAAANEFDVDQIALQCWRSIGMPLPPVEPGRGRWVNRHPRRCYAGFRYLQRARLQRFLSKHFQKTVESFDIGALRSKLSSSNQAIGNNPTLS